MVKVLWKGAFWLHHDGEMDRSVASSPRRLDGIDDGEGEGDDR